MLSRFSELETSSADGALRVRFRLRLRAIAGEANRPAVLAYQVLDPDTGNYLQEGEHRPLEAQPIAARDTLDQAQEFQLAPSLLPRGRARVVISLLDDTGWRYRQGDPYLRVDIDNRGDALHLLGAEISSAARDLLPRLGRTLRRALILPVASIVRNQRLIRTMVRRDMMGRYRGSFAGVLWSVLNPLLLLVTYYFVFGVVLQARFGGDPSREGFVLYFLAGMLPWIPFSEALGRAPGVLLEHSNFIKKLVFPVETLPINLVASGLVLQGFAILIFLGGLLLFRGAIPAAALWLPVLLVPLVLLTIGLAWMFAALGLLFRDLGQIIGYLLTLWFFLTPICYPEESLPAAALPYISLNPFFWLVRGFRDVLLAGQAPQPAPLVGLLVASLAVFFLGHGLFHRLRRSFADLL
ncbi:MAG: ABC transporter permease [Bryobacterales bacterium]|jgi:lipopolysaccharide transport system permease protein|nr:ABC transporter permease [Bryobacterales bacterium]